MADNLNNGQSTGYQPPRPADLNPAPSTAAQSTPSYGSPRPSPASSTTASSPSQSSTVSSQAASTAQAAKATFTDLQDKASEDLRAIKDTAKDQAQHALDSASDMAAEQKNFIASKLGAVASALEKVGGELNQGDERTVGRYAQDLGGSAKRLAEDLKGRDMREIMTMAESFGRKQPLAFLGLAALAGLAASRFVTASAERHAPSAAAANRAASGNSTGNSTGNMGHQSANTTGSTAGTTAGNVSGNTPGTARSTLSNGTMEVRSNV